VVGGEGAVFLTDGPHGVNPRATHGNPAGAGWWASAPSESRRHRKTTPLVAVAISGRCGLEVVSESREAEEFPRAAVNLPSGGAPAVGSSRRVG
jgi:hypothetical protein